MKNFLLAALFLWLAASEASALGVNYRTERGNIYAAGPAVTVTDNSPNDIVAAGGQVVIGGNAGNEVLAAGGTVLLSGKTGGDVRAAGGTVTLTGQIGGEAVLAGEKIHIGRGSLIGSDLMAASRDIRIQGRVGGNAKIIAENVFISGTIDKDVSIKAGRVVIAKDAVIKGALHYEAPQEAQVGQGAVVIGGKTFTQTGVEPGRDTLLRFLWVWWIVKLIAAMTAALAVYLLARERTLEVTAVALNRFGPHTLTGFIVLIVVPAAILLLFATVLGSLLALLALCFYIAFILLSTVFGALVFTRLLSGYIFRKEASFSWPIILIGVLIYQLIGLIPFLGWILKFVFFLSALGVLFHMISQGIRERTDRAAQQ